MKNALKEIKFIKSKRQPPKLKRLLTKSSFTSTQPNQSNFKVTKCGRNNCSLYQHIIESNSYDINRKRFFVNQSKWCDYQNVLYVVTCNGCRQHVQSTLVISNSKGLSETLRDIRTSIYQSCTSEENNKSNNYINKWICNLTPDVRDILKMLWKRGKIAPYEQFLLFFTIFCYLYFGFNVKTGTRISLRDKLLFDISEVEITRVDCIT